MGFSFVFYLGSFPLFFCLDSKMKKLYLSLLFTLSFVTVFSVLFSVYAYAAITPAQAECSIITNPESGLSAYTLHDTGETCTVNYVDSIHDIPGTSWWLLAQVRQRPCPESYYGNVTFYLHAYDLETDSWEQVDIASGLQVYESNGISGVHWNTSLADLPGTNCDTWNPTCPAAGTSAGTQVVDGNNPPGPWCESGINCLIESGSGLTISYQENGEWFTNVYDAVYTGSQCSGGESGNSDSPSNPDPCDEYIAKCNALCRDGNVTAVCNETERQCSCEISPPFPLTEDTNGNPAPDQDTDGIPSQTDTDVDGDGTPNSTDTDIDGDGIPNTTDNDIDGDGTGNGGDETSWNPSNTSPDGAGRDPDVDGDGRPNGSDLDIDQDGILNADDSDMDGDGIPNGSDIDANGDGILDEGYSEPSADTGDGQGTGYDDPGSGGEDTDEDGVEDTYSFDGGSVNFTPLFSASNALRGKFPISLVYDLKENYEQLTGTRQTPLITWQIYGHSFDIDLAPFDDVATLLRTLLSLFLVTGTIIVIIKMWSN